ncbi:nuclear inhibitor of protein phosphatase 1 [Dermatophagoides farinae]|uniref:nuclear inhibitor of protein phosphatase 1 n=1 Tax=Dermatophagoides farinae TaxID=6954 RepID=UPI003F60970F
MMDPSLSNYKVPSWAGIPPPGHHLDVMKDGKLVQKLMIDEKNHYLFGRNLSMTDFCIDHASCSRVHAALVYHKNLERFFLVDLGSTHGSFIGSIRIEANSPTQLPIDSCFHFGASTRNYVLREKPKKQQMKGDEDETQISLPDCENEIDHLTEYNTAQNRRVSMLGVSETDDMKPAKANKRKSVQFYGDDEIINPEDVDPNVGKFRNLVQTSIIPSNNSGIKRMKIQNSSSSSSLYSNLFKESFFHRINTSDQPSTSVATSSSSSHTLLQKNCSLGIQLPNPAPDIDNDDNDDNDDDNNVDKLIGPIPAVPTKSKSSVHSESTISLYDVEEDFADEKEKKKKYAKEAWPGHEKTTSLTNF